MRRAAIHYPSDHDASMMRRCAECGRWYRALVSDLCAACRPMFGRRGASVIDDAAGREDT